MSSCKNIFESNGEIARHLDNYEVRPQQIQMAEAVEDAISGSQNLIVEAGTGVGKSLAYLVPFILWAISENKRVVISTYTKALQNQLFVKDLPFLSRALDIDFRYTICMGSENYVCLRKARRGSGGDLFETKKKARHAEKISKWLRETETGLLTDMDFVPERSVWSRFSRDSVICKGKNCRYKSECFHRRVRRQQTESHILVTNHALLFSDIASEARVLPEFHGLVLDEAHTLEDVATRHFGKELSSVGIQYLTEGISKLISIDPAKAILNGNVYWEAVSEVKSSLSGLKVCSMNFFEKVLTVLGDQGGTRQFEAEDFSAVEMRASLEEVARDLMELSNSIKKDQSDDESNEGTEDARAYAERARRMAEAADLIFDNADESYVYWADVRKRKDKASYYFYSAPIDISCQMREYLFERINPVVLTSATLSSSNGAGGFSFIQNRLGLEDFLELSLDSPFDYDNNVLTYLPRGIADPNTKFSTFKKQVQDHIESMYDIMGGRIFALFTSYDMLNTVADGIAGERPEINILKQGDLPRYVLLDVFKKNKESVLLGTTTFWQGVDVPGEALECVIITKLPFSVPSDPINASRIKAIRDLGENPFNEYQIPQAVIMFKQGFGRLIRSHSDRGVVVVLDPRIQTRFYGKRFIAALPKCRQTGNIQDVKDFFGSPS